MGLSDVRLDIDNWWFNATLHSWMSFIQTTIADKSNWWICFDKLMLVQAFLGLLDDENGDFFF